LVIRRVFRCQKWTKMRTAGELTGEGRKRKTGEGAGKGGRVEEEGEELGRDKGGMGGKVERMG